MKRLLKLICIYQIWALITHSPSPGDLLLMWGATQYLGTYQQKDISQLKEWLGGFGGGATFIFIVMFENHDNFVAKSTSEFIVKEWKFYWSQQFLDYLRLITKVGSEAKDMMMTMMVRISRKQASRKLTSCYYNSFIFRWIFSLTW